MNGCASSSLANPDRCARGAEARVEPCVFSILFIFVSLKGPLNTLCMRMGINVIPEGREDLR